MAKAGNLMDILVREEIDHGFAWFPGAVDPRTISSGGTKIVLWRVVAGGAWSRALTAPLGDLIPLETERGYNTTLPPDAAFDRQWALTVLDQALGLR